MKLGKIQHRVLDVLFFWLEGFFTIDFEGNAELIEQLRAFVSLDVSCHIFILVFLYMYISVSKLRPLNIWGSSRAF